ncbi:MAG: hypothetical protein B6247_22120 [Candidatus Parabeggiatoa sp. nov. 2]|nr:MAG: hypothetical protein B6247_22120 [Beggiatoa sp. 4572_84]
MSLKNKAKLEEINEKLRLIGWFRGFEIPQELLFGHEKILQIKDKYIDKELGYFDQTSVSEGFLYLLLGAFPFSRLSTTNYADKRIKYNELRG